MSGKLIHFPFRRLSGTLLALGLLISACTPVKPGVTSLVSLPTPTGVVATMIPQPTLPAPTLPPTAEAGATLPAPTQAGTSGTPAQAQVTVDLNGVAQSANPQVVDAVTASAGGPPWEVSPQYTRLDLQGYMVSGHLMKPQIFIYPVSGLASANQNAGQIAANLKDLLESQQTGQYLPYLPMYNAQQVLHPQVKFLDFKTGKGVRFLTQFDQAMLPINNHELHYTFQGLTSDGKYYVAAVLPVSLPDLPRDEKVTGTSMDDFVNNFAKYLTDTTTMLNQQPADAFTPDLSKLDAMMQSLEVK